jgi:hypothetical protein
MKREKSLLGTVGEISAGGLIPGALFAWYHAVCFGNPFYLPMKFANPELQGKFSPVPSLQVLYELTVGPRRGVLPTQPWLVISGIAAAAMSWSEAKFLRWRPLTILAMGGLLGLLWMNAGFEGWHGGGTPGPRYMCVVFPIFGILAGAVLDQSRRPMQLLLWSALAAAVVFRMLVYCDILYAQPGDSLWYYYTHSFAVHFFSKYAVSFVIFWVTFGTAYNFSRSTA